MKRFLFLTILFFAIPTVAHGATDFIGVVDTGNGTGTDYTSLSAWETGVQTDLTAATTLVFAGTKTGTMADNASVTGETSGATATIVHVTSTQILLESISGIFQSGEQIRIDASNYFTTSNTGDSAIAVAKCRASTAAADTTAVTIDGWTTSATNYIKVWTDPSEGYRHSGKWDDMKYQLNNLLTVSEDYVKVDGLQFFYTTTDDNFIFIRANASSANTNFYFSNNIVKGNISGDAVTGYGLRMVYTSSYSGMKAYVWNNIFYDWKNGSSTSISALQSDNWTTYFYNNTAVNNSRGFLTMGGTVVAKNNVSYSNTADYSGTFDSSSTHNLSKDDTAPAYGTYYRSATVTFADETNDDFHLAQSDIGARNVGTDLSADADLLITTDIDGSTRTGTWDIGADEAAIPVFYSVGQNTTDHKTGSPTITIASGTATFSVAQTATNMGVGDKVTYNTTSIAYISEKVSSTTWKLITATGGTPADVSGQTVNSIAHAFSSINAAIPSSSSGSKDSLHLNTNNLVTGNYQLNVACYYDTGSDSSTYVSLSNWTTNQANYVKIYTPSNTVVEVNRSQRHNGRWTDAAYAMTGGEGIGISIKNAIIDGIQVKITSGTTTWADGFYSAPGDNSSVQISNNIIEGNFSGTANNNYAIRMYGPNAAATFNAKIYNNIIYGFINGSNSLYGIWVYYGKFHIYNNTIYNSRYGIAVTSSTTISKNNISYNNTDNYNGTFSAISTNNLSGPSQTDAPGSNPRNAAAVIFADETNKDFRLSLSDTGAKDYGTDLATDAYLSFTTDIEGKSRSSIWDIGASEAGGTTMNGEQQIGKSLTDGLVLYQSFNGEDINGTKAIDRSGQGNDGTITGATKIVGKRGQTLNFDGVNDYVSEASPAALDNIQTSGTGMSFSAWIKNRQYTYLQPLIIGKGDANSNGFWMLFLDGSGPTIRFNKDFGTVGWGQDLSARADYPNSYLMQWKHVVVTWDGSASAANVHFYIDGSEVTKTSSTDGTGSAVSDAALNLFLGSDTNSFFDGMIDEARLYNRALSADEIESLYKLGENKINSGGMSKNTSGLVGHWSFDGKDTAWTSATAGTTNDLSGNSNTGTLTNMSQSTSPVLGKLGQGLNFDGADDYVNAGSAANLDNLSAISFSFWANMKSYGSSGQGYFGNKGFGGDGWSFASTPTGSTVHFWVKFDGATDLHVYGADNTFPSSDFNKWIYWTVVWDGSANTSGVHIYKNGTEISYAAGNTSGAGNRISDATSSLKLGTGFYDNRPFNGIMDDVRVYNRVLSTDEIFDIYKTGQVKISK